MILALIMAIWVIIFMLVFMAVRFVMEDRSQASMANNEREQGNSDVAQLVERVTVLESILIDSDSSLSRRINRL